MEKTVLVELTSKQIKLAEGIVLFVLFVSLLAGFGLLSIAVPLGLGFFCRIRTPFHRRSARTGIFSSYVTVFHRFLSGANLSLLVARISVFLLFRKMQTSELNHNILPLAKEKILQYSNSVPNQKER